MSYSYIKSVFPKFEYSTVYDDKLYSNLNLNAERHDVTLPLRSTQVVEKSVQQPVQVSMQKLVPSNLQNVSPFETDYGYAETSISKINEKNLEKFDPNISKTQSAGYTPQNNLKVYLPPLVNNQIPNYNNIDFYSKNNGSMNPLVTVKKGNKENFDQMDHDLYIKHVVECNICKQRLLKQFNVETERMKNEEIMELLSYIMFGIFVLILLDSLKK